MGKSWVSRLTADLGKLWWNVSYNLFKNVVHPQDCVFSRSTNNISSIFFNGGPIILFQDLLYRYNNQDSVVLANGWIHRLVGQNRRPRNRPTHTYHSQLIFHKVPKAFQQNKGSLFNKWCWKIRCPYTKKYKPRPTFCTNYKI